MANSGINNLFIFFKLDPHLRCVAIMSEQKAAVQLTTESATIWAMSSETIHWLKDSQKHGNSEEWQPKYYEAIDTYVDELNTILEIFSPEEG